MLPLLFCLLLETDGEAKAKALLTLAAAAAQTQPAPDVGFFERLTVMPTEVAEARPPKPVTVKPRAFTLNDAAALAERHGRPLILWVGGHDDPLLRAVLPDCDHVFLEAWHGSAEPGVAPTVVRGGGIIELGEGSFLPAKDADAAKVRAVLRKLSGPSVSTTPTTFFAPRAANC